MRAEVVSLMKYNTVPIRPHRGEPEDLAGKLNRLVVGQQRGNRGHRAFRAAF